MSRRSAFVQIRVTPEEKATLLDLAGSAGQDLSRYVLSRALPAHRLRFEEILRTLRAGRDHRFALAELNDLLAGLAPVEFPDAVGAADLSGVPAFVANYVAAMVEHAAQLAGIEPPAWTMSVEPLERPHFATALRSLRLHLLRSSPLPFKRRNIFVDSSVGARV